VAFTGMSSLPGWPMAGTVIRWLFHRVRK
jgi:hypothetical protein